MHTFSHRHSLPRIRNHSHARAHGFINSTTAMCNTPRLDIKTNPLACSATIHCRCSDFRFPTYSLFNSSSNLSNLNCLVTFINTITCSDGSTHNPDDNNSSSPHSNTNSSGEASSNANDGISTAALSTNNRSKGVTTMTTMIGTKSTLGSLFHTNI